MFQTYCISFHLQGISGVSGASGMEGEEGDPVS